MNIKNSYYVIGGQYAHYCHGGRPTLLGAKRLARACAEYWDNWRGWHVPSIYRAEDTYVIDGPDAYGNYGARVPREDAEPVAVWDGQGKRFVRPEP